MRQAGKFDGRGGRIACESIERGGREGEPRREDAAAAVERERVGKSNMVAVPGHQGPKPRL